MNKPILKYSFLLPLLLVFLTSCSSLSNRNASYMIATAEIAATLDTAKERHVLLVDELSNRKDVFTKDELKILKEQLIRIGFVRQSLEMYGSDAAGKLVGSSVLLNNYSELRDAYQICLDIIKKKADKFPLRLALAIRAQERDAIRLDNAVQLLLSQPIDNNSGATVATILQILGAASKIAMAVM